MPTTIAQYTSPIEAHIAKGRLELSGIPVYVADEHYIGANWMISNAIGGVKLQVHDTFAERASRIIQRLDAGNYEEADLALIDEFPNQPEEKIPTEETCPFCQSEDVQRLTTSWRWVFVALMIFNFPFPYSNHNYQCRACSRKWLAASQRAYPLSVQYAAGFLIFVIVAGVFHLLYSYKRLTGCLP